MAQPTAHQFAKTEVGGYASVQQGDRHVINTIHIATAYFTLQGRHDLLHLETAPITTEQFEDAMCGRCGCPRLVLYSSGSAATHSVAESSDQAIRSQKMYSLKSSVTEPTQSLSAYANLIQAQQTDAERRASEILISHKLHPSTHVSNGGSNAREASLDPLHPTSVSTMDVQIAIPGQTINALYSQVVRESPDPQLTSLRNPNQGQTRASSYQMFLDQGAVPIM